MKEYLFSVIIPIYDVEQYLEETIKSVINQTVGFENIQLILVNDGSPDNSEEICLKYKEEYPDNIIYINQKNSGVSSARNNGLKLATGKYINFLDSDDIWDNNAFEKGLKLFNENSEIGAVIYPLKFFEGNNKNHPLNFMFKEDTTVNILKDYKYIKLSSCSTIIRKEELIGREFSNKLKISEDCRLITEIFLDNPNIGVVASAKYNYRKRITQSSTIQTSSSKKTWYIDTPIHCYQYIVDLSKKKYGKVIDYIQYLLAYDLHWRMDVSLIDDLTEKEKNDYLDIMHYLLNEIDDRIIIDFKSSVISFMQKLYMLAFKYRDKNIFSLKNNYIYVGDTKFSLANDFGFIIDNIVLHNDKIDIYGRQMCVPNILENIYLYTDYGNIQFDYYVLDKTHGNKQCLDKEYQYELKGIHATVDLSKTTSIKLMSKTKKDKFSLTPIFTYSCMLNNNFTSIYLKSDNYYFKYIKDDKEFRIYKKNIKNKVSLESKCLYNLLCRKRFTSIGYRICSSLFKLIKRKQIWLVSDRIQIAKDNGEAFFEYLMNQKKLKVKPYFIISDKSDDYKRLKKKYGKYVVGHKSFKHKLLHLNADKIISAQADNYVVNLFGDGKDFVGDLYKYKFIFLQHGITKDDLSPWLNINSRNIDLFITAALSEYNSMVDGKFNYNYPKENIKLTGFARFDKLINNSDKTKTVLIMPTWRKYLVSLLDQKTGNRIYDSKFRETEYFKFYNSLTNDKRLLEYLKKKNYRIKFVPHINMSQQIKDFANNELTDILTDSINYTEEFKNNSILITDYSSVFFDFCYLNKPVIYTQFDSEEFFSGQAYDKGYFSYEKNGFGPVVDNIESAVDEIIKIIDNDCKLESKYFKRIEKFYKFHDQNNCKRIYEEILKLDNK